MRKSGKQISILLALAVVLCGLSFKLTQSVAYAEGTISEADYSAANTILENVYSIAEDPANGTEAISSYLLSCPEVEEDSIRANGACVQWQLQNGIRCSYSPYIQSLDSGAASGAANSASDSETISYSKRSAAHGSDIYLFEPYYGLSDDFTDFYQDLAKKLAAKAGSTYHYYKGEAATVDNIADALESGGIVIFNSHGTTDYSGSASDNTSGATTSYLCLETGEGLTAQDYEDGHALYGGARDGLNYYQVDGTVLTNHMERQGANGLVWMAICLGMATDGLAQPLVDHGADVVFGYSESVTFKGEACFATYFYDSLMSGNTVSQAAADMKATCGAWDYSPELCNLAGLSTFYMASTKEAAQSSKCAFPIVVSTEDPYPGQAMVNDLQTVHSTWTFRALYSIQAFSGDQSQGTVSVSGLNVIATPAEGYEAKSCTVEPEGAAVVTQSGNRFRVSQLRQNCTITVDFQAREPGTLSFQTPDGVTQADLSAYIGDPVTLPTPKGQPQSDTISYEFAGWAEEPLTKPAKTVKLHAAGESYPVSQASQALYAVYRYLGNSTGEACAFTALTASRSDWSGTYILASGHFVLPSNFTQSEFPLTGKSTWSSAQKLGMGLEDGSVLRPNQTAAFRISRVSGTDYYVIRLSGTSNTAYLAVNQDSDRVSVTSNFGSDTARWRISLQDGIPVITSYKYPERSLRCVRSGLGRYLACVKEGGEAITLYQAPSGTTAWYTSACITGDGITVSADLPASLPPGQAFSATVTVKNQSSRACTARLYIAQYDENGKMLSIQVAGDAAAPAGETATRSLSDIKTEAAAKTLKLMVLDCKTAEPLCSAYTINFE